MISDGQEAFEQQIRADDDTRQQQDGSDGSRDSVGSDDELLRWSGDFAVDCYGLQNNATETWHRFRAVFRRHGIVKPQ